MFSFFQGASVCAKCSRRKQTFTQPACEVSSELTNYISDGVVKVPSVTRSRKVKCFEKSGWDLSNESTDDAGASARSLQSSDTEASSAETPADIFSEQLLRRSVGLPPGLQLPVATAPTETISYPMPSLYNTSPPYCSGQRLSMHAKPFVPSSMIQPGFAAPPVAEPQLPWTHLHTQGECQSAAAVGLQEVISKLSPQDAATILDSLNAASNGSVSRSASLMTPAMAMQPMVHGFMHPTSKAPFEQRSDKRRSQQTLDNRNAVTSRSTRTKVQQSERSTAEKPSRANLTAPDSSTLKENLRQLSLLDPQCVILVRKISKLGLNSAQLLEIHFSQFGPVQRVFVSHSIEKPSGRRVNPRWRPASLGFVAMYKASDAAAAMSRGVEQSVLHTQIHLGPYEDHFAAKLAEIDQAKAEEVDNAEEGQPEAFEK